MALTGCPECGGKVSSRAVACPHCGYPVLRPAGPGDRLSPSERVELAGAAVKGTLGCVGAAVRLALWAVLVIGLLILWRAGAGWMALPKK